MTSKSREVDNHPSPHLQPSTCIDLLRWRARHQVEQAAYTFLVDGETEGNSLSYGGLDLQARGIASRLAGKAVRGDRVLLLYPPGLEFISAFYGCLYAGLIAVPAYPPDPARLNRSLPRVRAIIQDAHARIVLTTTEILAMAKLLSAQVAEFDALNWFATDVPLLPEEDWEAPLISATDIAFLQYTSGSTGAPKGVILTHDNLLHNASLVFRAMAHTPTDKYVSWLPMFHDMGFMAGVLQPLYAGIQAVLLSPLAFLQKPLRWLQAISKYQATTSGGPNFAYDLCVRKVTPEQRAALDLSHWTVAFNGAEPVRAETLERFAREFASCGFRRETFYPCYGLAEATLIVSGGQKGHPAIIHKTRPRALEQNQATAAATDSEPAQSLVSCGRSLGEQQVAIVNRHSLTRCSSGEVGEIWVAGPSVAQGYWNRPDETAKTFAGRLADTQEGPFLRTGDMGFLSDGELFITGRIKDLIIIRGRNLYPQDIELTAERSHAALRPGCGAAFAVEVAGQERLVLVQEVNPLPQVNSPDIIDAIRQAIVEEHEVPVYAIALIKSQSIAKTSSGKIRRHACRNEFLRGGLAIIDQWVADITNLESAPPPLALVRATSGLDGVTGWLVKQAAAKLGLPAEQIDPDEPITRYGLDSLMAVELMHELESYLDVSLPLVSFLDGASLVQVAAQAQALAPQRRGAATASALVAGEDKGSALPLSSGQRALWFLHRLAPDSAAYNIIFAARIHGALDEAALRRSFQFLIDRHASLRTTFIAPHGEPFQRLQQGAQVSFQITDAADWSESRLQQRLSEQGHLPFDLEHGPLLRVDLFIRSPQKHVLLLGVHHSVADLWALSVMMQELGEAYAAEIQGRLPALPALELQFADYARWESSLLSGQEGERLWRYWREQLAGPLPALDLPTDRPRPPVQTYRGASQVFYLDADLSLKVQTLAHARGTTLYMTLLAAFQALLYHYTGQSDILVGTPTAGRTSAPLARLVGYFVNPIVLRARLSAQMLFSDFLQQVRQTVLAAFDHQGLPFPLLVERLQPQRDLARSPLFQAMFILQKAHLFKEDEAGLFALGEAGGRMPLGNLELESLALEQRVAQFDLTLMAAEVRRGLVLSWQYNADLFDHQTIAGMADHFQALLEQIAAAPEQRLGDYSLLNRPERQRLLAEWNVTATPQEEGQSIHQLFQAQAEASPDAVAVEFEGERLTYGDLNYRANQLAHHLRSLGIGAESLVGICMPRCPQLIVGLLGILKAGAAYVPLDPTYPKARLNFMLADARPAVLLTNARLRDELGFAACPSLSLDSDWPVVAVQSGDPPAGSDSLDHLAYVIYTSGSTGVPKGVLGLHRGAINRFQWMWRAYPFAADEVCCQKTSLSFVDSIWEIFGPLLKGVKLVLIPDEVVKDPQRLSRELGARRITRIVLVPALLRALLDSCDDLQSRLPELNYWVTSGEALPKELAERFFERLPGRRLINLYGSSEVSADATCYEVSDRRDQSAIPIGRPIANTTAYVLGSGLQLLPGGVPGQLCIGGAGLARGYHNRPDLTAERFLPDPLGEPGGRLYLTGDIARTRASGEIDYLGRADHQLKIRGFRVELGEIEATLGQAPGVRECVVQATGYESGDQQLIAYVVAAAVATPSAEQLRAYLRERLPDYMIPAGFMALEALPLTPNGKVNRRALPAWQPESRTANTAEAAGPTEIERGIAAIWREVLRLKAVGVNDNFFDLGGHSILLTQVQSKLRKLFDRDVSIVELFKYPSIRSLARYLAPPPGEPCAAVADHGRRNASAEATSEHTSDIAIVGMAGRFPGADNLDEFWRNLRDGVESITFFTDQELQAFGVPDNLLKDARFVKAGAQLREPGGFDANFFGYSPRESELMDPQHRLFLECAWHAFEDAGYDSESYRGSVGVFTGMSLSTYLLFNLLPHRELIDSEDGFQVMIGGDKDFLSTRVSYKLNLRGPSIDVQTACSTSLVAVHLACESLRAQRCDMALAGGVSITVPQRSGYLYQEDGILSPDGHCRAFDAKAQGTLFGSGVGAVVLKRLEDALADQDSIYAVIKGSAINNDGSLKIGYTAPSIDGQAQVITEALAMAGAEPETITYLEAHGTATPLGDPVEVAALTQAFGGSAAKKSFCALGSVKTNIGHLDAAAGIAGLIKSVLALKHGMLPPSLHFEQPNPKIDFADSPFYVNARLSEWRANGAPRRAGVSSFGIGGTNAHLVLEEAPAIETPEADSRQQLLVLSARTSAALERATDSLVDYLKQNPASNLADVAYTLQIGRRRFDYGRCLIVEDREAAILALEARDPRRVLTQVQEPLERPVAFMFSGQGSQHVNMGRALYQSETAFRQQVDRCAELLKPELGSDLRDLLYPGPNGVEEARRRLTQTAMAQPALFVIEYALAQLWMQYGVRPQALLGHSIGEYVAACLAGVFSLEDALRVVSARGRLMQQLAPGAMLAVPLAESELLRMLDEKLAIAAINGESLCVVSGPTDALNALEQRLAESGIAGHRLHTSHAFHSAMMEPILDSFTEQVSQVTLNPPRIAYISNVTGTWITSAEATDPRYYARHLREPVRFASAIGELLTDPNRILLEVGPGQTLSGLAGQHPEKQANHVILPSLGRPQEQASDDVCFLNALSRMWLSRVPIAWSGGATNRRRQHLHLPTYPFEHQRYWIDPPRPQAGALSAAKAGKQPDLADWFYAPIWKQSLLPAQLNANAPTASPRRWLVCLDGDGLGRHLVESLRKAGHEVITIRPGRQFESISNHAYTIDFTRRDDYARLCQVLDAANRLPDAILHLWSLSESQAVSAGAEAFQEFQDRGFYSLLFLMQAFGKPTRLAPLRLYVLSNRLCAVESADLAQPEKATLLAACRVIAQEYPQTTCRCIDVALPPLREGQPTRLVEQIMAEINDSAPEPVVAYRGHQRWLQVFEPIRLAGDAPDLRTLPQQGVYLITGGLGLVGLRLAEYLARTAQATLILTSRSPFPPSAEWDQWLSTYGPDDERSRKIIKLRRLEEFGARVIIAYADVSRIAHMRPLIEDIYKMFGQLNGVIHAAGLVGEQAMKMIDELDCDHCESHFRAKVYGTYTLAEVLRGRALDFCLLCSSTAAILGGVGAAGYAAANLFLDAFANQHSRDNPVPWISVNWDGWRLDDQIRIAAAYQTGIDQYAMTPPESIEAFRRIVSRWSASQVIVSTGDLPSRYKMWVGNAAARTTESRGTEAVTLSRHPRPLLSSAYVAPTSELEQRVAEIWQEALGIEPVGMQDNFFDLGGNSLLGLKVISRLRAELRVELPVVRLFEGPTIQALAQLIGQQQNGQPKPEAARGRGQKRRELILQKTRSSA